MMIHCFRKNILTTLTCLTFLFLKLIVDKGLLKNF